MSRFFFSILLWLSFSRLAAQAWDSLPLPGSNITVATWHNGAIFVANGDRLGLYRSTDNAGHWERLGNYSQAGRITSITSLDNQLYVSTLYEEAFDYTYRSLDNGTTWSLLSIGTAGFGGAKAYRKDTVFRSGNGMILRYLPGGIADTVFSDNTLPINRLLNVGAELWMLRSGEIWHSANGTQWNLLPSPPPAATATSLYYLQNAVFFFGDGNLYRSGDSGVSWSLVAIPTDLQGTLLSMTEVGGTLYAGISKGSTSHFLRSTDGGITWTLAYKGIHPAKQWLVDGPQWVIRTDLLGLLRSNDNGNTWWDSNYGLPDTYALGYCRLDNGTRLCSTNFKGIFRSTDEGQSWQYVLHRGDGTLTSRGNQVASLNYDSLLFSNDNGTTWNALKYEATQYKKGIWLDNTHLLFQGNSDYLCDLNVGTCQSTYPVANLAVAQGKIFGVTSALFNHPDVVVSDDLGSTWTVVGAGTIPPWTDYPHRVFATDSVVIVYTTAGKIFLSKDNGASWQVGGAGLPEVADVFYSHTWTGWGRYVGVFFEYSADGQGYVSDDFGASWTAVYTPTPPGAVAFSNASSEGLYYLQSMPSPAVPAGRLLRFGDFSENAVRGLVFNDLNNNGLRDAGEAPLPNIPLWLKRAGTIAATDAQGHFSILPDQSVLPDTLTIEPFASLDAVSPAYYLINGPAVDRDFGLHFDDDVAITINSGSDPRPGYLQNLIINCQNTGTVVQSGLLKLIPDPQLTFIPNDTLLPAPVLSGDTLIWDLGALQPFQNEIFKVLVRIDSAAMFGDTLRSIAILDLDMPDLAALNDRDTLIQVVVASFDPNDKTVAEGAHISVDRALAREALHYRIRFQNTGNFPAFQIVVRDTLSNNLDAPSIRLLASSHTCQMVLSASNIVEFRFHPIYLPDSISSEPESHGFVEFSIKPKPNRVIGDLFENTAFIYFDANLPVKTNTVHTVITNVSATTTIAQPAETLHLMPNPSDTYLTINLQGILPAITEPYEIQIFDALGRTVFVRHHVTALPFTLPVANLHPGLHWVTVSNAHFKSFGKFMR